MYILQYISTEKNTKITGIYGLLRNYPLTLTEEDVCAVHHHGAVLSISQNFFFATISEW